MSKCWYPKFSKSLDHFRIESHGPSYKLVYDHLYIIMRVPYIFIYTHTIIVNILIILHYIAILYIYIIIYNHIIVLQPLSSRTIRAPSCGIFQELHRAVVYWPMTVFFLVFFLGHLRCEQHWACLLGRSPQVMFVGFQTPWTID